MTATFRTRLAEVCAALNAHGARYVLMGAPAMQLCGFARTTRDIDILIEPSVENAGRVLSALGGGPWAGQGMARP